MRCTSDVRYADSHAKTPVDLPRSGGQSGQKGDHGRGRATRCPPVYGHVSARRTLAARALSAEPWAAPPRPRKACHRPVTLGREPRLNGAGIVEPRYVQADSLCCSSDWRAHGTGTWREPVRYGRRVSAGTPTGHAGVAQWQSPSLPSWSCGFDSRRPLQRIIPGQREFFDVRLTARSGVRAIVQQHAISRALLVLVRWFPCLTDERP
jgi:hypothetical protein